MCQVFDVDARKRGREGVLGRSQRGHHHFVEQQGSCDGYAVDLVDRPGGTQDIVGRDAALLAGEFITPARSPDAFENSVTHERLQDRLQMARRQPVARRQGFGCDRTAPRVERDVDDGGNGQNTFARQERHG